MKKYTEQSMRNILKNAKNLGVKVKKSEKTGKKFDVFNKNGEYLTSIGDSNYMDYYLYKQENKELAEKRKNAHKARHQNNIKNEGSAGYYSFHILWNYFFNIIMKNEKMKKKRFWNQKRIMIRKKIYL